MSDRIDWWFIHTTADVWAAWGQWVGGIGTTVAVAIALWVALGDRRRRTEEVRDAEAQQARQLLIKAVPYGELVKVLVKNRSNEAIQNVLVNGLTASGGHRQTSYWKVASAVRRPNVQRSSAPELARLTALHPGETWVSPAVQFDWSGGPYWDRDPLQFAWPGDPEQPEQPDPDIKDCTVVVTVSLMDGRGRSWRRTSNGTEPTRILPFKKKWWQIRDPRHRIPRRRLSLRLIPAKPRPLARESGKRSSHRSRLSLRLVPAKPRPLARVSGKRSTRRET